MDQGETSEVDIQEDIEFALIQMKAETLNKINEALTRLEEGRYGLCFECGDEIAEQRLRALPFAVRCKDCEEAREIAAQRERSHGAAPRLVEPLLRHPGVNPASFRRAGSRRGGACHPLPSPLIPASFRHRQLCGDLVSLTSRQPCYWAARMSDRTGTSPFDLEEPRPSEGISPVQAAERIAGAAAARHGAVPEFVHATGGGSRELRPAHRRGGVQRQPDRGLHPARAGEDEPQQDLHPIGTASTSTRCSSCPTAACASSCRAWRACSWTRSSRVRPYLRARVSRSCRSRRPGPPRDRRAAAEHQDELPADRVALAADVRRPADAGDQHHRAGRLADFIASSLAPSPPRRKQEVLATLDVRARSTCSTGSSSRSSRSSSSGRRSSRRCSRRSARTSATTSCASS
jgi:hypothetical protein